MHKWTLTHTVAVCIELNCAIQVDIDTHCGCLHRVKLQPGPVCRDLSRLDQLKAVRRGRKKKFHIVTRNWVRTCLEDGELHSEKIFEL